MSTYDIDKTHNSTLKIPWFHTPASQFSQNGHYTMGKIAEWKMVTMNIFRIFRGIFFAYPLPDILTKHNIKENSSKWNIRGKFDIPKGKVLGGH